MVKPQACLGVSYELNLACGAEGRCVDCEGEGQKRCQESRRAFRPGEQNGLCDRDDNVCSAEGLCVPWGGAQEACRANQPCPLGDGEDLGCCVGGLCVADGASCGDGSGTCSAGACTGCGNAEGEPCCDGSLLCDRNDTCVCGGEGEICCVPGLCDNEGLACFDGICHPGVAECPTCAPLEGTSCNYLGRGHCEYWQEGSILANWCVCTENGWVYIS